MAAAFVVGLTSSAASETLRWASVGDIVTFDPHAHTETHTPGMIMGPYAPPQVIMTEIVAEMPEKFRSSGTQSGRISSRYARPQIGVDFYLEGPSFDRLGNLYFVDVPHGRIFRMRGDTGEIELAAEYDGEPNGLKIHRDGRIFIADFCHGIMIMNPETGGVAHFSDLKPGESFKGLNDLVFGLNGDVYFTDQGKTGLSDPTGRVYRFTTQGSLETLIETLPGPNGLVLSPDQKTLYVGSRNNAIWWMPLNPSKPPSRVGTFATLPGFGTPDGMAVDSAGNVFCCQMNMGVVWGFNNIGLPIYRIESAGSPKTSNLAFGGSENRDLFILDGKGRIMRAELPDSGLMMYSHMEDGQ